MEQILTMESMEAHQEPLGEDYMGTGNITVVEGEDAIRTVLSLQFVYRGSTLCREYGYFISGIKSLEEIESVMNRYGMSSEYMKDSLL